MQIDYNQYIIELQREEKEAKAKFEASAGRPCMAEKFGRWEALGAALDLVVTMTKDTTDLQLIADRISSFMEVGWTDKRRNNPWNQRYDFGRALGFATAYNLLREHAARTIHVVPMREPLRKFEADLGGDEAS